MFGEVLDNVPYFQASEYLRLVIRILGVPDMFGGYRAREGVLGMVLEV